MHTTQFGGTGISHIDVKALGLVYERGSVAGLINEDLGTYLPYCLVQFLQAVVDIQVRNRPVTHHNTIHHILIPLILCNKIPDQVFVNHYKITTEGFSRVDVGGIGFEAFIITLTDVKKFQEPIVTEIKAFKVFYPAEVEHKDYYNLNSKQPYCAAVISPKVQKLLRKHAAKLK